MPSSRASRSRGTTKSKATSSDKYVLDFIACLGRNLGRAEFEGLEEYPEDKYLDESLGLSLYHAGINPYDPVHYRHQLYIVVEAKGKASKLYPADKIVANVLSLQYASKKDIIAALINSAKRGGHRVLAGGLQRSANRCGQCGHNTYTSKHQVGHIFSPDECWMQTCCQDEYDQGQLDCCVCSSRGQMGIVEPLDTEHSVYLPESGLPVRAQSEDTWDMARIEPAEVNDDKKYQMEYHKAIEVEEAEEIEEVKAKSTQVGELVPALPAPAYDSVIAHPSAYKLGRGATGRPQMDVDVNFHVKDVYYG